MKISDMLTMSDLEYSDTLDQSLEVRGVTDNSNENKPEYVFITIKWYKKDGHIYIQQAIINGTILIIGENEIMDLEVLYLKVKSARKALGQVLKLFYKDPSKDKVMIRITGTNSKNTISFFINIY